MRVSRSQTKRGEPIQKKYLSPKKEDYQATVTIAVTVKVAAERVVSAALPPPWTRTLERWVLGGGGPRWTGYHRAAGTPAVSRGHHPVPDSNSPEQQ